jgi:Tfp pilus assembly protein PilF
MSANEPITQTWETRLREGLDAAKAGDREGAMKFFQQAAENDPTGSGALAVLGSGLRELGHVLTQRALSEIESGNTTDAEHLLLAASEMDPENAEASVMLQDLKEGRLQL